MPYQAQKDCTVPRVLAEGRDENGEATATYESVTYALGAVIYEGDIAPHILRRLEEGDDHLSGMLRYIDEDEAREILASQAAEASGDVAERELLHQDERGGDSPTAIVEDDSMETQHEPEAAEVEDSDESQEAEAEQESEETETEEETDEESETTEGEGSEDTQAESETEEDGEAEAEESAEEEQSETDESSEESEAGESEEESSEEQAEDLDEMSKRQLTRRARELNIENRTKMSDDELKAAIRKAQESK